MRAKVWGCRGSLAAPGPDTVRYGGNTSCVEVRLTDGTVIVLDAGTGIRALGLQLETEGIHTVHLFLSHLHLDHLQGLGFFNRRQFFALYVLNEGEFQDAIVGDGPNDRGDSGKTEALCRAKAALARDDLISAGWSWTNEDGLHDTALFDRSNQLL